MQVQPKGTATTVKRGRPPRFDQEIEQAIRLLEKTTDEIVLTSIVVDSRPDTYGTYTIKMKYRSRISTISNKLGKSVSVSWTEGDCSSPVVSLANR